MTYIDYYQDFHGVKIKDKKQPLLKVLSKYDKKMGSNKQI